jgi:predicted sulfurtransferase
LAITLINILNKTVVNSRLILGQIPYLQHSSTISDYYTMSKEKKSKRMAPGGENESEGRHDRTQSSQANTTPDNDARVLEKETKKRRKKEHKKKHRKVEHDQGSLRSDDDGGASLPESAAPVDLKLKDGVTLVLFYQYIEPPLSKEEYHEALQHAKASGEKFGVTGRMRVAKEGFNCTLTGPFDDVRGWCTALRQWRPNPFSNTEFKFTDNLPEGQRFPKLNVFQVEEIVNYGLAGSKAPAISQYGGCHLEPSDYHKKMAEKDTVIIDVRNHYEANIGRFEPPPEGAKWLDPMMRKSTEFPLWLDKPETKEMLRGKQVLMYCTGGIRCERASALLRQKIDTEEDTKELGIKGVFQLQGGVDKYFKDFPEGGKSFLACVLRTLLNSPYLDLTGNLLPYQPSRVLEWKELCVRQAVCACSAESGSRANREDTTR